MYTYDVQYPEFEWDQVKEMGIIDQSGAIEAFRKFPFRELIAKAATLGPESTAPTITFRSQSDKSSLSYCMRASDYQEVYMENGGLTVTVGPIDESFMIDAIASFFSGGHSDLYERLARQSTAVNQRGLWKRVKSFFAMKQDRHPETDFGRSYSPLLTISCSRISPTQTRSASTTGRTEICEGRSSIRRKAS